MSFSLRSVWLVFVGCLFLMVCTALLAPQPLEAQSQDERLENEDADFRIARVQYDGGGDWYTGPESLPELLRFIRENTALNPAPEEDVVRLTDDRLYDYPFLYLTGHGNVEFSEEETRRLRHYLENGGFIHIDDDYGLDPHIRREMEKVFPDQDFQELPYDHEIYHVHYSFPDGVPKIHEHDGEPARGYGLFDEDGRLVVYYTHEADLGNGWDPPEVHGNPEEVRLRALRMGANIMTYAVLN